MVFGSSRYTDRLPIGLLEVLEVATADDLRGFYERWYRPNLMAIVVVGDIDVAEMEAMVKRHFAPPPEGEAMQARAAVQPPTERPRYEVPSHAEPRVTVFTDPKQRARVHSSCAPFHRVSAKRWMPTGGYW